MMNFILNISGNCSDPGLAAILSVVKRFMNILWIVGPILAIVGAGIAFYKLMSNPDEKKYKNLFKNMIIALIVLFLLPAIVNAVMKLLDGNFDIASCWNQADSVNQTNGGNSSYIDPNKDKTNIYTDPDDFNGKTGTKTNSNVETGSATENTNPVPTTPEVITKKLIFVGDSRTVGMKAAVGDQGKNDVWSCKSSMGLSWMKSTGIPNIENQITNGSCVIILMGVNDLYNADNYISYINGLVSSVTQKGGKLYFVSVNPTNRSAEHLNDDIDAFNLKLKNGLSSYVKYIDTNTYLMNNGFSSGDGVHYTNTTYKQIYTLIKGSI